jgi:hypothetical protein
LPRAPGRAWTEEELRRLGEGFIEGTADHALATAFNRTRGQLKELRQGFECARGNLDVDDISPVAATWVARWRRVLGKR